jgi:hypothetical protein
MVRVTRALLWLGVAVLFGCGGGGGGNEASGAAPHPGGGTFSATFKEPEIEVTGVEGTAATVSVEAALAVTGEAAANGVYLSAGGAEGVLLDVEGYVSSDTLVMTLTVRGDLAPGDYSGELELAACFDEACTRSPQGSPVRVPIRYRVLPNIQVQRELTLGRSGREAAPSAVVPVTVPPGAGVVEMQMGSYRHDALAMQFDGNAVHVTTQQVPAGVYTATVTLRSTTDARYSRSLDITYTVLAPPGGEHPLSVVDPSRYLWFRQGATDLQRIVVTRPTWTSEWETPVITHNDEGVVTFRATPDGNFEAAINTAGIPPGTYYPSIRFGAGPTGGMPVGVSFNITVADSFYVDGTTQRTLTATSNAADLEWSNAVLTFDEVPARWTAVSQSPLLQVVNGSGQTGSDPLLLRLDPAAIARPDWSHDLPVTLSIDRPGTLAQTVHFSMENLIPTLHSASPSALVGSSGRVYVEGNFRRFLGDPLAADRLRVEGATLSRGRLVADPRYIGDVLVLELDLSGATPGQPVRLHVDSALQPSQVELQVQAPLRATTVYQALPFGDHRPGQYAPGLGAFYFSKPGVAYRWQPGAGGVSLTQASVAGLIDIAPSHDEQRVYASTASQLLSLHPETLAQQAARGVVDWMGAPVTFSLAADHTRGLSFSADGRALASLWVAPSQPPYNVGTVCVMPATRAVTSLIDGPRTCDPGSALGGAPGSTASGTVRSANGSVVVSTSPEGWRSSYRADERAWVSQPPLPAGVTIAAVADTGARLVRSDGMLITLDGTALGNLGGVLPFTHRVGGYGLSSGGRFGFVYGYRVSGVGAAERASDATLWVIDLVNAAGSGVSASPIVSALPLPSAVGCTAAFASGETCQHVASVSVAPGDGTAFVVGPRGVAAVGLPTSVTSAQPLSTRVRPQSANAEPVAARPVRLRGLISFP